MRDPGGELLAARAVVGQNSGAKGTCGSTVLSVCVLRSSTTYSPPPS